MVTKVQKWGNSQGLRLSKQVLETARIAVGDDVEIVAGENEIIVRKRRAKKYDLAELISRLPRNYRGTEEAFGKPVGKEAW
ncbi:MAG TPA: AbrB/MazE/SpoVT family DNA-binding domain-containing protein [Pirellulales bacterium]|nr:AbrB/MazE/SpoVT family DNA-binding domain-containing protein [Pirellulales bacterium]